MVCTAAGLGLRLIFFLRFPAVVTDSFLYGDIAKNWLQHGIYGLSGPEEISATLSRLPGYPAFLAIVFSIFGMEHYHAALLTQILFDVGTCFFCADIARRLFGQKAAKAAFLLAALCPFLANYSAAALTETLEIFFTVAAFDCALAALFSRSFRLWSLCGLCCGAAILLRPDGALMVIVIVAYLAWQWMPMSRGHSGPANPPISPAHAFREILLVCLVSGATLIPWTVRNWQEFHVFQPLAPRYATDSDEYVPAGFNRWVKTWMADYASVEEVYWQVPGAPINPTQLPARASDDRRQREATVQLIGEYNQALSLTPELDSQFAALAAQRIHSHPFRYYVELPAIRVLDMWLRPRTELLPPDVRWWEFNDDGRWIALALGMGAINLGYVICALAGWLGSRNVPGVGLPIFFVVLRSLFLGTLENPEPRYTLEMYPIVIVLSAAALAAAGKPTKT